MGQRRLFNKIEQKVKLLILGVFTPIFGSFYSHFREFLLPFSGVTPVRVILYPYWDNPEIRTNRLFFLN